MADLVDWGVKTPQAVLEYAMDWSATLDSGVTVTTSTWSIDIPNELVIDNQSIIATNTQAAVVLSGGRLGRTYVLTNKVGLSNSKTDSRSVKLTITTK